MKIKLNGTTVELDDNFVNLTEEIKGYLTDVKAKFDQFDSQHSSRKDRINFLNQNKISIYEKLTDHFKKIWQFVNELNKADYLIYQKYYQKMILPFFLEAEINRYIYSKPLGYAGDFRMMNYIFDYSRNFLGETGFEMLINYYTCNISISQSNIERRDYLKSNILNMVRAKGNPRIISVGGGPLRELIELLLENKINRSFHFFCLDFEPLAIDFVKSQMEKIDDSSKKNIIMEYLNINVKDLLKDKVLLEMIKNQDLIYISGVFDYLSDRFCSRLLHICWGLLREGGKLIICNTNLNGKSLRAYFEFLGEWKMNFRTKESMLQWTKDIDDAKGIGFDEISPGNEYLFMSLKK